MSKWKYEKEIVENIQNIKKEIDELLIVAEKAEREGNYEKVAKIRYDDLPCLLYTSDAADERSSVDLGGRRIIKKKKQ